MSQHRDYSEKTYIGVCSECFQEIRFSCLDESGKAVDKNTYSGKIRRTLLPHCDEYGFRKCKGIGKEPHGDDGHYYEPW